MNHSLALKGSFKQYAKQLSRKFEIYQVNPLVVRLTLHIGL